MKKTISLLLAFFMIFVPMKFAFADEGSNNDYKNLNSKSAILMDASTGQILYQKDSHKKLPPASVTKIMTMLLIVESIDEGKLKLTDNVKVSENASGMGGSQIFLETGDSQTVDTMLKGIAVASANDACVAMAEHISGSVNDFVAKMNKRAKQLNMNDTHFANTNGLPNADHYTSANDIAIMSRELLKHSIINKYLTTWMDKVVVGKKKVEVGIANTNKLIKQYEGATGVKTGFTKDAKYCLSASAKRGNTQLIAVTLGAETTKERFKDATNLLNYGFANYESKKLAKKGDKVCELTIDKSDKGSIDLVVENDLTALVKKGDNKGFKKIVRINKNYSLPIKQGTTLGKISVVKDNKVVGEAELVSSCDINKANYVQMLQRVIENLI